MTQFWRKRLKNRWAAARYWPEAEGLFWGYRRLGLFAPIQDLFERFGAGIPEDYPGAKYIHRYGFYLRENIARGVMLALPRAAPLRLLDLGSGPGYFLYLCRHWGHDVQGIDVAGNQIFDKLTLVLELPREELMIVAQEPLPTQFGLFELITAYSIDFDEEPESGLPWSAESWRFFIDDMAVHLVPEGRLFLRLNLDKYGLQSVKEFGALYDALTKNPAFDLVRENHRDLLLRRRSSES